MSRRSVWMPPIWTRGVGLIFNFGELGRFEDVLAACERALCARSNRRLCMGQQGRRALPPQARRRQPCCLQTGDHARSRRCRRMAKPGPSAEGAGADPTRRWPPVSVPLRCSPRWRRHGRTKHPPSRISVGIARRCEHFHTRWRWTTQKRQSGSRRETSCSASSVMPRQFAPTLPRSIVIQPRHGCGP